MREKHVGAAFAAIAILLAGNNALAQESKREFLVRQPGSKMAIETPLKRIISKDSSRIDSDLVSRLRSARPELSGKSDSKYGRTVQPGLVSWHADVAAACLRSRVSGKPVLVFQMMGKLDQEFC